MNHRLDINCFRPPPHKALVVLSCHRALANELISFQTSLESGTFSDFHLSLQLLP